MDGYGSTFGVPVRAGVAGSTRAGNLFHYSGLLYHDDGSNNTPLIPSPGAVSDNAISRYDGVTGAHLQNSAAFINDSGGLCLEAYFTDSTFRNIRHSVPFYNTGTASQSGTTVTGSGTTWTGNVIGKILIFADGTRRTVSGRTSNTVITVLETGTVSSQAYAIDYPVFYTLSDGTVAIGYPTTTPGNGSKLLVYGGANGANVDAQSSQNPNEADQATFEAQGSDYGSTFRSAYIQYYGPNGTGTTSGFTNHNLALLALNGLTSIISSVNADLIISTSGAECARFDTTGQAKFASPIRTSGVSTYFKITAPADTGLTASTEAKGIEIVGAVRQHATGAIVTQREVVVGAPTYSFVAASTITTAITVDIADPIAGTNATLTNAYSLRAANVLFTGVVKAGSSAVALTNSTGNILGAALVGTDITTVGTLTSGTWQGNVVGSTYGGTGVNNAGRTLTIAANSGTISFSSAALTLTIAAAASVSGTNTGDITIAGQNFLSLTSQVLTANPVTFANLNTAAWSDDTTLAGNSATVLPTVHAVKTYVDTQITGLKFKVDVRVASTGNVSISSAPSSVDGVTLSANDRVLLKNQTTGSQNGVYVFASAGAAMSRAADSDTGTELISATYPVREGTVNQDTWWTVTNDTIVLETDSVVFTQTGGAGTYTAGSGLTLTGNSFSIGAGAISNSMLAGSIAASKLVGSDIATVGTITTGTWAGTVVAANHGGTGQTVYAKGDILASPGSNTLNKLTVGSDGQVLTADAASTNGVKWAAAAGGSTYTYIAQTATYTILTSDQFIDCTSGTFTVTLPTAVGVTGKFYIIKNSGTGVITIATTSSQTIDGSTTQLLTTQYTSLLVVSDGANWKIA